MPLEQTGKREERQVASCCMDCQAMHRIPARVWSPQQQEVLDAVRDGLTCDDTNVTPESRALFVTRGPGTSNTEVVLQCALNATSDTTQVLIACPIGPLVAVYRKRIPPHSNIVVETIHSSNKITRKADEVFIPPGRLRHFDLIIFDEVFSTRRACLGPSSYSVG